jgi:hypothetical protein
MAGTKLLVLTLVALLGLFTVAAWAQNTPGTPPPADTLKVDYFANANTSGAPDATVRTVHPGTTYSNLCADIFVFDTNEEMSECCSCIITPDGRLDLSVNSDLTANPLTRDVLADGVIKIISAKPAAGGDCPVPQAGIAPAPTLRHWTTHIQNSNFTLTENVSPDAKLSNAELINLQAQCKAIVRDGSGHGICASKGWSGICNF